MAEQFYKDVKNKLNIDENLANYKFNRKDTFEELENRLNKKMHIAFQTKNTNSDYLIAGLI